MPEAIELLLLEYITPGTVVTYGVELLLGPRPGDMPMHYAGAQEFVIGVLKFALPVLTAFTIKKACGARGIWAALGCWG